MLTKIYPILSRTSFLGVPSLFTVKALKLTNNSFQSLSTQLPLRYFSSKKDDSSGPELVHPEPDTKAPFDKIDLNDERVNSVFQSNLQTLSLKFFQATSSREALKTLEQELKENPNLGGDELCVAMHFVSFFRGDVSADPRFQDLIKRIFVKINEVSPLYLLSLLTSLASYCANFNLTLSMTQQEELAKAIEKNFQNFDADQICDSIGTLSQINSVQEEQGLVGIIHELSVALLDPSMPVTEVHYTNLLLNFLQFGITNDEILNKLIASFRANLEKFGTEDLSTVTKLVMALSEFELEDPSILEEIFDLLIKPQILNLAVNDAANLILAYADIFPDKPQYFKELVKNIHVNYPELTASSYLNVWLTITQYSRQDINFDKTLEVLKQVPKKNETWKLKDLQANDLTNIIIAIFSIGFNDQEFLNSLTSNLKPRLGELEKTDLISLARVFVKQAQQNQEFYTKVYQECCNRVNEFESQEKKILKETFDKTRSLGYLTVSQLTENF